jgi:hypothetical protein
MLGDAYLPVKRVIALIFLALRKIRAMPSQRQSTAAALGSALGVALAGSVLWGLIALLLHIQLALLGVLIGAGVGAVVARFRPGHMPTIIAGAVIAVAGCAFGTLLGEVFYLLNQQRTMAEILGHLNAVFKAYPGNVGGLGWLFFAIAAFTAIRVPLNSRRRTGPVAPAGIGQPGYGQPGYGPPAYEQPGHGQPGHGQPQYGSSVSTPAPMTGPSPAPASPAAPADPDAGAAPGSADGRQS